MDVQPTEPEEAGERGQVSLIGPSCAGVQHLLCVFIALGSRWSSRKGFQVQKTNLFSCLLFLSSIGKDPIVELKASRVQGFCRNPYLF